jgi:hypothetical protein
MLFLQKCNFVTEFGYGPKEVMGGGFVGNWGEEIPEVDVEMGKSPLTDNRAWSERCWYMIGASCGPLVGNGIPTYGVLQSGKAVPTLRAA